MGSATTDRRMGLAGNTAYKTAATALAAGNIVLSGEQTVGGVAVKAINAAGVPDRVLCIGQTDATTNGLWDVNTGTWTRSVDADGNYDWAQGSQVIIARGTYAFQIWVLTTANPITVGTTAMAFSPSLNAGNMAMLLASGGSSLVGFIQAGAGAVARTLQSKVREIVSVTDYGAVGDGAADDSTAPIAAIAAGAKNIFFPQPASSYYFAHTVQVPTGVNLLGDGMWAVPITCLVGIPAIWVQQGMNLIRGLQITFVRATGVFAFSNNPATNTNSVGIMLRATNAFSATGSGLDTGWSYINSVTIEKCAIYKADMSIQAEAAFDLTIRDTHTYWDFIGVSNNYFQTLVHGGSSVAKTTTTLFLQHVYCHGAQTTYANVVGSMGMYINACTNLAIDESVCEFYQQSINSSNITCGVLSNYYQESVDIGVNVYGINASFHVINAYCIRGISTNSYAFRGDLGNMTFTGGFFDGAVGTLFFSPGSTAGTVTFLKLPKINAGGICGAAQVYVNGYDANGNLILGSQATPSNLVSGSVAFAIKDSVLEANHLGLFTTAVPVSLTKAIGSGGMVFVTGYSLSGGGWWLVCYGNGVATVVASSNTTGGAIAFSCATTQLTMTSTGTASQVLQECWVHAFSR